MLRISKQYFLFGILFIIQINDSFAQFYVKGQEPASTVWLETNDSSGIKTIFPSQADSTAKLFSNYLIEAYRYTSNRYNKSLTPVPAIIHPNSVLSNGFVSWAPKRMEIVSTPLLDSDPEPWLKTLAFHETQHVAQLQTLNSGFFKGLSYLFGQQAPGAAVGFVPLWFLEGDAVYHETAATNGGRGRDASFYQFYRTHILSEDSTLFYSYDKWLLGSYKDYTPNHYKFGYLMVGYANHKYGEEVWQNTLKYVSSYPYTLFPFYFGFKKQTGLSRKQLFNQTINHLDSTFSNKLFVDEKNFIRLIDNSLTYTNYSFPHFINDSILITLKKKLSDIPTFVSINIKTQRQKTLRKPGIVLGNVNYSGDYAIWAQHKTHPRWEYVNWSEIWIMNLTTGKTERITNRTRYANPVFFRYSNILAIEQKANGRSNIVLLDLKGNKMSEMNLPDGFEPKEIAVNLNGGFALRMVSEEGVSIFFCENFGGPLKEIVPKNFRQISNLLFVGNLLLFRMSENFKNDIFSVNTNSGDIRKITDSKSSIDYISYYNYSNVIISINTINGITPFVYKLPTNQHAESNFYSFEKGLFNENPYINRTTDSSGFSSFSTKKYKANKNLFHIHSWAPLYYNPTDLVNGEILLSPGLSIFSQNLTSTLTSTIGYSYKKTHGFHSSFNYTKFYPIISFGIDVGSDFPYNTGGPTFYSNRNNDTRIAAELRVFIPTTISSGRYISKITPSVKYSFTNDYIWNYNTEKYNPINDYFNLSFTYYNLQRLAHRDLRSRLGYYFSGIYTISPSQRSMLGSSAYFRSGVYLPGLFSNQSLLITSQFESSDTKVYLNRNRSILPRGYNPKIQNELLSVSADYSLPVSYPDMKIGSIIYIKRLIANFYFDFAKINELVNNGFVSKQFGSYGLELYADTHFFRTRYEFRIGYRIGKTFEAEPAFHQFLLSFNIESIYGFLPMHPLLNINL